MADRVRYNLDKLALFFKELEDSELFSKDEVKSIVKKVTDFEYTIARAELTSGEYFDYLNYEINLDKLFNIRLKKLLANHNNFLPKSEHDRMKNMQKNIIKQINYIFERGCRRFPQDESLFGSHISFLKEKQSYNLLDLLFGRILSLFPKNIKFWIQASTHELHNNNNLHAARVMMQRALRANQKNAIAWKHFFDLELYNYLRIMERKKVLGIFPSKTNENDSNNNTMTTATATTRSTTTTSSHNNAEMDIEMEQVVAPLIVVFRHSCQSLLCQNEIEDNGNIIKDSNHIINEEDVEVTIEESNGTYSLDTLSLKQLWPLLQMMLSTVSIDVQISSKLTDMLKLVLKPSSIQSEDVLIVKYLRLYEYIASIHPIMTIILLKPSTDDTITNSNMNNYWQQYDNMKFMLEHIQLIMDKTIEFILEETTNVKKTMNIAYLVILLSVHLSNYLFSMVVNQKSSIEDILQEIQNIYYSYFEQIASNIFTYQQDVVTSSGITLVKELILQNSLQPEVTTIVSTCSKLINIFNKLTHTYNQDDAMRMFKALLSELTLYNLMGYFNDVVIVADQSAFASVESIFPVLTKGVSYIDSHYIRNNLDKANTVGQLSELLKLLFDFSSKSSTNNIQVYIETIVTDLIPKISIFTTSSHSNEFLENYFFLYLSANRQLRLNAQIYSNAPERNSAILSNSTCNDSFNEIYRCFLCCNTDCRDVFGNELRFHHLSHYLQLSQEHAERTFGKSSNAEGFLSFISIYEDLLSWVMLFLQKYSMNLIPTLYQNENSKVTCTGMSANELHWKVYIILWEILKIPEHHGCIINSPHQKRLQELQKRFLHEIIVMKNELVPTGGDTTVQIGREKLLGELTNLYRAEGNHEMANHLQYKKRRFS